MGQPIRISPRKSRRLALILIVAISLAPIRFDRFGIQASQADWWTEMGYTVLRGGIHTWHKEDDLLFRGVVLLDGAKLTIEKGATIRFTQAGSIYIPVFRVLDGSVVAKGTQEERITFKAESPEDRFGIAFQNENPDVAPSLFRYAVVSGGGYAAGLVFDYSDRGWKRTAAADSSTSSAVEYLAGRVHIENTEFAGSRTSAVDVSASIGAGNPDDFLEIVNSNFDDSAEGVAVSSSLSCDEEIGNCVARVLLKNNWYGSGDGPVEGDDEFGGESLVGDYLLDGFRRTDLIADPVVIVPGMMGSAQFLGEWQLDPIMHTYDDLMSSLGRNGYEEGKNLFPFAYDWRRGNETTALYLQSLVEGIIDATRVSRVDVVAHSMGGLVTRAYVEETEGAQYEDTIDQMITLGTPHLGSPEAYLKWEAGEGFFTVKELLVNHHFTQEAEEAGYDDLMTYIREKVPSVEELLPVYDYLFDAGSDGLRAYHDGYPRNTFLEDLNSERNVAEFDAIDYTSIIGSVDPESTISTIRVVDSTVPGKWEHGMPENYYDAETDRGLRYGKGDETVPDASARGVAADRYIELPVVHNALPTKAQCDIFRELTGKSDCDYDEDVHIPNILLFNVFSPVDIQVVAPSGRRVGKDFRTRNIINEISGAFYTGFDGVKSEFVTIPNPEEGEYRILTQGTDGGGVYRIEASIIREMYDGSATESTATIEGEAEDGSVKEDLAIDLTREGINVAKEADVTAPQTSIALSGPEGDNGWYLGDVMVTLSASDNEDGDGVERTEYSLDGGVGWGVYSEPLAISAEGKSMFLYRSIDKAGNMEENRSQEVKIDKTAPEARISFDPKTQKLDIQGIDAVSGGVSVAMTNSTVVIPAIEPESRKSDHQILGWLRNITKYWIPDQVRDDREKKIQTIATLTDEAGHKTELSYEEEEGSDGRVFARMRSVAYDGGEPVLSDATVHYEWRVDRNGTYRTLVSHLRAGETSVESRYFPRPDETWIMERLRISDDDDIVRWRIPVKRSGMVVPHMTTAKGSFGVKYPVE